MLVIRTRKEQKILIGTEWVFSYLPLGDNTIQLQLYSKDGEALIPTWALDGVDTLQIGQSCKLTPDTEVFFLARNPDSVNLGFEAPRSVRIRGSWNHQKESRHPTEVEETVLRNYTLSEFMAVTEDQVKTTLEKELYYRLKKCSRVSRTKK